MKKTESNGPGALAAGLLNGAVCVPAQMKRTKVLAILGIAAMGAATVANAQCPVETSNLQNIAMLHWSLTTPPANRTPLSLDFKTAFFAGNGTTINVPTTEEASTTRSSMNLATEPADRDWRRTYHCARKRASPLVIAVPSPRRHWASLQSHRSPIPDRVRL